MQNEKKRGSYPRKRFLETEATGMDVDTRGAKLIDVARVAKCSPATVSRVLNGNPTVNKSVGERVLRAARELGYVPNGSARALRRLHSIAEHAAA